MCITGRALTTAIARATRRFACFVSGCIRATPNALELHRCSGRNRASMRERPTKANPLDPVTTAFQPRRAIRVGRRARVKAGPYSDLDPPPDDGAPAKQVV
jgi:hypothetical protein